VTARAKAKAPKSERRLKVAKPAAVVEAVESVEPNGFTCMHKLLDFRRDRLTPALRRRLVELVTGHDEEPSDLLIGATALDTLAKELAVIGVAFANVDCAESPLVLSKLDVETHLARVIVRARALSDIVELLEHTAEAAE